VSANSERPYIAENARELARLRALVERATDEDLTRPVNEAWTVAGVLGHLAFWDSRALWLATKIERGEPFAPSDTEPEDVSWLNDSMRPLIHAIRPRQAAVLALQVAEDVDRVVALLEPDQMWPMNDASPLNAHRAEHRGEHLGEIEAALGWS
jgi:hypothetical protein